MKVSIKKSRTTDKTIAVINGRIKVGEVINGLIVPSVKNKSVLNAIINHNQKQKP
jgi:hypothetical protein